MSDLAQFKDLGLKLVANGWSVFPQDKYNRAPAKIDNFRIRPISYHNLDKRLPLPIDMERWNKHCGYDNVAVMMGRGSGGAVAIDLDITDKVLADKTTAIALKVFGYTPLQRIGNAPKIVLFYREDNKEPIKVSTYKI